jgi:hypothetical protein
MDAATGSFGETETVVDPLLLLLEELLLEEKLLLCWRLASRIDIF